MSGVNRVILVGRLGKDPDVRNLEGGVMVANFTLATSETYRDRNSGDRKEVTEWHNIVLWRGLAEIAQKYLHKGDMVYIEGKLRTRSWEKDGVTRYSTEVVADNLTMLSSRGSSNAPQAENATSQAENVTSKPAAENPASIPDTNATDDLPF